MGSVSVVGTWRLVSSEGRSSAGDVSRPYGDAPVGFLIYGADGYMSATLMRPGRPHFASGDRRPRDSPRRCASRTRGSSPTAGPTRWTSRAGSSSTAWRLRTSPTTWATDLVRRFVMENGTLVLETQPVVRAGKTWVFRLVWAPAGPVGAPGHAGRAGGAS